MASEHAETICPTCRAALDHGSRYCGSCGGAVAPTRSSEFPAQSSAPSADMIGREVGGRYRILTKLGEGGMGAVYRAEQISLKRIVALKVLKPELSSEPALVRRFNTEATLAAKLNHPNTVTLFDFGQDDDGALFIAMEYIEGKSLRQVLVKEGPLPPDRVLAITSQICGSLSDAHTIGIVHRDLKPDNVMLFVRGKQTEAVSVLDFGIAKLRDEHGNITQQPMTQAGDILGTPQYMAPEQIRGDQVDARTDVYALGVMLYEMVTARLPFEGATVMALLSKHLTDTPVEPVHRRPELAIPAAISQVIMRCLAKSPDDRPSSMDEVEELLAPLMPTFGGPSPTPASFRPPTDAGAAAFAEAPTGYASLPQPGAPSHTPGPTAPASISPPPGPPPPASMVQRPSTPANLRQPEYGSPQSPPEPSPQPAPLPTARVPAPRRSRTGMWVLLTLILVGAAGAGGYAFYASSQEAKEEKLNSSSGEEGDSTTENPLADEDEDVTTTRTYTDPAFNYRMTVPTNFDEESDGMGTVLFTGEVRGHEVTILAMAWPGSSGASDDEIEGQLAGRLAAAGVVIIHMEWTNSRTLIGEMEAPDEPLGGEFVLSRKGRVLYFAGIGSLMTSMSATKEFRKEFLRNDYEVY